MSRKTRSGSMPQFHARIIEMMESPAYRVLSLSAHRVLDRICIELAHKGGKNNGKLPVTYEQFVEHGIDRHAIKPAIRELCALGFIEVTEEGRAGNAEWRRPNLFRLTFTYTDKNHPPTHEWKRIPNDLLIAKRIAATARGLVAKSKKRRKPGIVEAIAAVPKKQNPSGGFPTTTGGGFPHRKSKSPVGVSRTTSHSGETPTTSISPLLSLSSLTAGSS